MRFGNQCVVCAIDARRNPAFDDGTEEGWEVYVHGGGEKEPDWMSFPGRRKHIAEVQEKFFLPVWNTTGG